MSWKRVRFVTLTLDRKISGDGETAYNWAKANKPIGRFIQNLGRAGVEITDWTSNIEWHDDGTPHWHLLIEVAQAGRSGRIGQDVIHRCWPYGRIHETFFKSRNHFRDFLGYFKKSGYLHKDKQHQIELPAWASSEDWRGVKINRFSSMRHPSGEERAPSVDLPADDDLRPESISDDNKTLTTYQDRLDYCGGETEVWFEYFDASNESRQFLYQRLRIPYHIMVEEMAGCYEDGLGFVLEKRLTKDTFDLLHSLNRYSSMRSNAAVTGFC